MTLLKNLRSQLSSSDVAGKPNEKNSDSSYDNSTTDQPKNSNEGVNPDVTNVTKVTKSDKRGLTNESSPYKDPLEDKSEIPADIELENYDDYIVRGKTTPFSMKSWNNFARLIAPCEPSCVKSDNVRRTHVITLSQITAHYFFLCVHAQYWLNLSHIRISHGSVSDILKACKREHEQK